MVMWCSGMSPPILSNSSIRRLWGHTEEKGSSEGELPYEAWEAGPGNVGSSWAGHDRAASALLESRTRNSPAGLSDSYRPDHTLAPLQMGHLEVSADALTDADVGAHYFSR